MKSFIISTALVLLNLTMVAQTSTENYILQRTYKVPLSGPSSVFSTSSHMDQVVYYDGLGRPKQTIGVKQAGGMSFEDLVTHIEYDQAGRMAKQYLPYPDASATGGYFKTGDVAAKTKSFYYSALGNSDFPGISSSSYANPYSEIHFLAAPIERPLEKGAPGAAWKVNKSSDSDHTIKYDYETNDPGMVRLFRVSLSSTYHPTLVQNTNNYYLPGELYKNIVKDENWTSGPNNSTVEYQDKQGRVVLKRNYNDGQAHDTYYVYDDYGNLSFVIPPKVVTTDGVSATELDQLCYQYHYDNRNRLIRKKLPGKGSASDWESIVYNSLDLPILTQDPNLKAQGKWLYTKYDAFGRVIATGLHTNSATSQAQMQTIVNNFYSGTAKAWEEKTTSSTNHYYTNQSYPTTGNQVLTLNYYDNYTFDHGGLKLPAGTIIFDDNVEYTTKGLPTGSRIKVLGQSKWITTVNHYDSEAKMIYSASYNEFLLTTEKIKHDLDFIGNVKKTETYHKKGTNAAIVITDYFSYDHVNRLEKHTQAINGGSQEVIAENTYDKLGQLISKDVGNTNGSTSLQQVNYNYNIRGWLRQINNPATLGSDLFGFKIGYNTVSHSGVALFNGNISETEWKTQNDNILRWYRYSYDDLNRITSATANSSNYNVSGLLYDKNGNILNLTRRGVTHSTATSFGNMDVLAYGYYPSSNRLRSVNDTGDEQGFKDSSSLTSQYTYDLNGNLTSDANKGIPTNGITYNHLNLPTSITLPGGTITYTYDALGNKLRKVAGSITTDYAGLFVYQGGNLEFFSQSEGYVEPDGSGGYDYVYQYKDHLGSVRLSYSDANGNDTIDPATEILDEKNYYPFGLEHKGYNSTIIGTEHPYKYNGKELVEDLGYDMYDFDLRHYDPAIARWVVLDPLAEQMRRHSPYNFAFNNPIFFIDPDGMAPVATLDDPIYNKKGDLIGDDGKTEGKIHIAYNKKEAKAIEKETKGGNTAIDLTGKQVVTLNGGTETVGGVVASVDAQGKDTSAGAGDAGLHEEGGHTETDANGNTTAVAWTPGPKKTGTNNASISAFNGVTKPNSSELADYWHVHTSGEIKGTDPTTGQPTTTSAKRGTSPSDVNYQKGMENAGYRATAIQVDTRGTDRVNFYTGSGTVTSIKYRAFKKLK